VQTPADIQDSAQLRLLGDILQPDMNVSAIGALRLRLMQPGFSWQALVELALGQGVLLPLIFALTKRSLLPPILGRSNSRSTSRCSYKAFMPSILPTASRSDDSSRTSFKFSSARASRL
jgi:hypothetical protein